MNEEGGKKKRGGEAGGERRGVWGEGGGDVVGLGD